MKSCYIWVAVWICVWKWWWINPISLFVQNVTPPPTLHKNQLFIPPTPPITNITVSSDLLWQLCFHFKTKLMYSSLDERLCHQMQTVRTWKTMSDNLLITNFNPTNYLFHRTIWISFFCFKPDQLALKPFHQKLGKRFSA